MIYSYYRDYFDRKIARVVKFLVTFDGIFGCFRENEGCYANKSRVKAENKGVHFNSLEYSARNSEQSAGCCCCFFIIDFDQIASVGVITCVTFRTMFTKRKGRRNQINNKLEHHVG